MNIMELPHCATDAVTPKSCYMYGSAMFVPSCSKKYPRVKVIKNGASCQNFA